MNLLVIEDEKDLNAIITKALRANGYIVDSCFDGEDACAYLLLGNYDGALLDIMLPNWTALRCLRKSGARASRPPSCF